MENRIILLASILILLIISGSILLWIHCDKFTINNLHDTANFKGVCLFDIDGTLSTGKDNERVVQYCLDKGYAVGISTAGSMYKPDNLMRFPWMPSNLFKFMAKYNFITFNNVASHVLAGKHDSAAYSSMLQDKPKDIFWPGWLKALTLERSGQIFNINDQSSLILFDNDPSFIAGIKRYNPKFKVVCAGMPCMGTLNVATVSRALS